VSIGVTWDGHHGQQAASDHVVSAVPQKLRSLTPPPGFISSVIAKDYVLIAVIIIINWYFLPLVTTDITKIIITVSHPISHPYTVT